jgi:hypothetical protein
MPAPATKTKKYEAPNAAERATATQSHHQSPVAVVDNRPAAVAQRQMQDMTSQSPQAQQAAAWQARIAQSPRQQLAAQRKMAATPALVPEKINKTGLPDELKAGVENLSGYSLDDVQVHYNSTKPAELQAHAYAQGTDIHLAPGQEQHLAHEAWHVVQQKQGRVRPTRQLKGKVHVNDDAGLEKEADVMGAQALLAPGAAATTHLRVRTATAAAPVQGVPDPKKRLVSDTRMDNLKAEAIKVLSKMMVLGADWETKYGEKGKEKGSNILGKPTDYKAELRRTILKEYWKTLSAQDKWDMFTTGLGWLGKAIGPVAHVGKETLGVLPELGSTKKEAEKKTKKPAPKEQEPTESWLSSLTLEEAELIYRSYSKVNEAFDKYAQAKAALQEKAGEIGEAVGAEVGRWRDEADFDKRMGALRQDFITARTKYELLRAAIIKNDDGPRYSEEIDALDSGLMNAVQGPAVVYSGGDLSEEARKSHPDLCLRAIQEINNSKHSTMGEAAVAALKTGVQNVGTFFGNLIGEGQEDKSQVQALAAMQTNLATELAMIVNKSWSKYTKWGSTPKGVKAIQTALPERSNDVAKLKAAIALAKDTQKEESGNRSPETQIFYDAIADLDVTNMHSLEVAKSIIAGIGAKLS